MNEPDRSPHRNGLTAAALTLILVGMVFLLRNLDVLPSGGNWWAYLLLIPLGFLGSRLVELRRRNAGAFPAESVGPLVGFLSVAFVMAIFLLDLDWSEVWPVFIILAGLSFLLGGAARRRAGGAPPSGGAGT